MAEKTIGVGIIGSGFVADIHAASFAQAQGARLAAVASSRLENAEAFAARHDIERAFDDYREILSLPEVDVVSLAVPNDLHCRMCVDAARAGKHVIIEKPLCRSLAEADEMIAAGKENGVHLFYAEELCFAPSMFAQESWFSPVPLERFFWSSRRRCTMDPMRRGSGMWNDPAAG